MRNTPLWFDAPAVRRGVAVLGWVVLAVLLALAARDRFALPPVALSEWDSWGWLKPALGWIGGAGFREEYEREWLYGAFLALALRTTGSMVGAILVQQTLGLAAAVGLWLTWRTWLRLFPYHLVRDVAGSAVGLGVAGLYLVNPITRALELSIRPEAILAFVGFAQLLAITAFVRFRWAEPRPMAAAVSGALAVVLALALYILKPNWLLAVPLTTWPVFLGVFGRGPLGPRLAAPLGGLALAVLVLWVPDKLLFQRTTTVRVVLPMTLFTIHADLIRADMVRELADPETPEAQRELLRALLPVLDAEMETARRDIVTYKRLGFDPDYLMYRARVFPWLGTERGFSQADLAVFCRHWFLSAVRHDPAGYAGKVLRQFDYFWQPDDGTFFRKRIALDAAYRYAAETLPDRLDPELGGAAQEIFAPYRAAVDGRAGTADELTLRKGLRNFFSQSRPAVPALVGLFALLLAAVWLWKPLAPGRAAGVVAAIFYGAPAGNALTVAMVHALDNARYRGSYGPLLVFALAAMLVFVVSTLASGAVLAYRRVRRD